MKKLNKRSVFSVVLALMLVFTVGFYSSAEQTTAWFTASGDKSQDFTMDNIDVEYSGYDSGKLSLQFDAATKFDDADERSKMFEHACKFFTVTVTNNGDRDALVFIDIATEVTEDQGLRYYIHEYNPDNNAIYEEAELTKIAPEVWVDSEGKRVIKNGESYFRTSPMIADDANAKACEVGGQPLLIELASGDSKSFCCVFWVEYDEFIKVEPVANGVRTAEFEVDVIVNAVQADYYPVAEGVSVSE